MANITVDLVNDTISTADQTTISTAIANLNTALNAYVHPLTDEERDTLLSLDVNNKVFVEETINEITNNGAVLPPAISLSHLQNDLDLFNQLDSIESQLMNVLNRVRDTKRIAGHEAYAMALATYTIYKSLANAGVDGTRESAQRLGERFASSGAPAQPTP